MAKKTSEQDKITTSTKQKAKKASAKKEPKKKSAKQKPAKQLNLEDILFECRNKLRGNANMTTKRDLLLTLVFLRFICSRFNEQQEKIRQNLVEECALDVNNLSEDDAIWLESMLKNKAAYGKDGVFYLEDDYNWDKLILQPAAKRAVALDNGITKLMQNEKNLKNALPANLFVNARLDPAVLKSVMDDVNKIDPRNFKDIDLIGRVYEYFLQQFAVNATKEDGEFYTPQSIVELIANLIEPFDGTVYDPCCGSGGMFVQCVRLLEAHGGDRRNASVYGQESDPDTYRLAKMNLAARGISYHLGDTNASSFTNDQHPLLRASYIMANPPFNLKDWRTDKKLLNDKRWKGYGVPPASNANYAWILHMLFHLDQTKGVAGFLLSNGALEDEDTLEIRKNLIQNDKVEAIFVLPREMFYSTDTSVTLWILNQNKKGGMWHNRKLRSRVGEVLFVDLRRWNQHNSTIKTDKSKKTFVVFDEKQINAICDIYHSWQTDDIAVVSFDEPELYHSADRLEIEKNNWSLTPSRYIRFVDNTQIINYQLLFETTSAITSSIEQRRIELGNKLSSTSSHVKLFESICRCKNKRIGYFIEEFSSSGGTNDLMVCGINKNKQFMPTVANVSNVDLSKYKQLSNNEFAFSGMQTGRDECIRIAMYKGEESILVSPAYTTFRLIHEDELLPEYFYLFFCRPEMDRYGWFISDSSVRANLDWPRFLAIQIPLPDLATQQAIVNIYHCAEEAKRIAAEADKLSREICPALMQHIIHEAEKNN